VVATLSDLAEVDGGRPVAVVRELTKVYEEVWRGSVADAVRVFGESGIRGEVVLVIGGAPPADPAQRRRHRRGGAAASRSGRRPRQVAAALTGQLGVARRTIYDTALRLRAEARVPPG